MPRAALRALGRDTGRGSGRPGQYPARPRHEPRRRACRPPSNALQQAGLSAARSAANRRLSGAGRRQRADRSGRGADAEASVRPHDHHDRCACGLRRRASRPRWRRDRRRHRQRSAGPCSGAVTIASAAGDCRSPTRAAAPGSAARRCGGCCGRMTAASAGPVSSAPCSSNSSAIRTPSCAGQSQASPRDFGSLAPRVVEHADRGDPAGDRAHAIGRRPYRCAGGAADRTRRIAAVAGWRSCPSHGAVAFARASRPHLVAPAGDALDGALQLARADAELIAA